jgi:tetratricopeptide (TPR) repeat protein
MSVLLALALAARPVQPVAVTQTQDKSGLASATQQPKDPLVGKLDQATDLIRSGKSAEALPILDEIIAAEENRYRDEKRLIFSAQSPTEVILYAGMGASQKKSTIVLDGTWSAAYFYKGFALIDVNRADEAKAYFDKAIGLAPMNGQFLAERGEWFKSRRDWAGAYRDFEAASTAAGLAPDQLKSFEQRRAWRGMAFARTEQGELNEARQLLQKCLQLDGGDDKCKHELDYVNRLTASSN